VLKIVFFGMDGRFSAPPLETLLKNDASVVALILPGPADLPAPRRGDSAADVGCNVLSLAHDAGVPAWEVGSLRHPATLGLLQSLQPDVIAVACFPRLFPAELLALPRFGCFNLHPSLLPAYRGPEPLFWIARNDERDTGVTLHFMDATADSGDIISQTRVARPDGQRAAELEQTCAEAGASLLLAAVRQLARGEPLPRRAQPAEVASTFPAPSGADFAVPLDRPARRAFNFLRAAEGWPLCVAVGGQRFFVRDAKSYSAGHVLDQPYILLGDELWVQFSPGVVQAKIWPGSRQR
jgi:methionyl-tRNA formyltransferase